MSVSSVVLRVVVAGHDLDLGHALGEAQRGLERVGEPALDAGAAHEPVDDHLDGVVLVAGQPLAACRAEVDELAVDPGAGEALLRELLEQALVLALAAAHDRREHLEARALLELEHAVDDLLRRLAGDDPAAVRAVRHADAGVEQAQVVVDLGDGADGRARVARRRLLVDGDRRRQALDEVDVGLVHLPEELAGVGGERLDVAALALGVDRVERERRLARAREPGEDDELVARQLEVDVAEVVLPRALHDDRVRIRPCADLGHRRRCYPAADRERTSVRFSQPVAAPRDTGDCDPRAPSTPGLRRPPRHPAGRRWCRWATSPDSPSPAAATRSPSSRS